MRLPLIQVERVAIRLASPVGAVAQLGERLNGIQEVRGSIPLGSTKEINDLLGSRRTLYIICPRRVRRALSGPFAPFRDQVRACAREAWCSVIRRLSMHLLRDTQG
jgi:hypothetical protein